MSKTTEYLIAEQFFSGKLNLEDLTQAEYKWYYDNLVIAKTHVAYTNLIYFDNKKYIIIKGEVNQDFNRLNGLVRNTFIIQDYFSVAIGDDLPTYLSSIFTENDLVYTNLIVSSILVQKLRLSLNYNFIDCSKITDLNKVYQDLIGTIEHQGLKHFFPKDKSRQYFKNSIALIDTNKTTLFPSEILALIHWFQVAISG